MLLESNFFTIQNLQHENGVAKATLAINVSHAIFDGHFPSQPVVPGVCLMQMVKELTETITEKTLRLIKADNLKFLAVVDPQKNNLLLADFKYAITENEEVNVSGSFSQGEVICLKFGIRFKLL